ncbi:hypothetical protein DKX38_020449 [Salix brachista]|uniref:P-type Cu(+) transporter n=1 Tax=Salix brachista TaxID=2182728 RepID=A0A5N5K5Z7_9ROSI|nr:hypothetical protein DKX38_020449 [Salix brachista]
MENYLNENFGDVKAKNSSEEALQRWRNLCWLVKNRKRRFRFTANLSKRFEAEAIRRSNQEKLRVAVLVSKAALQFIHCENPLRYSNSRAGCFREVEEAGFQICADELGSIVEGHDVKKLKIHGEVEGIAEKLSTSINDGISTSEDLLNDYVTVSFEKEPTGFGLEMMLGKSCVSGETREVGSSESTSSFGSAIPEIAKSILLESIFKNTGGEVVVNEEKKVQILGTPTETALLEFGLLLGGDSHQKREKSKVVKVEPFNSTKKRMGVVIELPDGGLRAHCKGASEIVLAACDKFIDSNGVVAPLDEASTNHLKDTIESFASESLRTLCLAYLELGNEYSDESPIPSEGYTCIGIVGIKDPVRPGVKESVAICRSAGIVVRMVTGDNLTTAKAIARECGILTDDGIAIEGPEFREKSEEELQELIPKIQVMARSSPLDKHTLRFLWIPRHANRSCFEDDSCGLKLKSKLEDKLVMGAYARKSTYLPVLTAESSTGLLG